MTAHARCIRQPPLRDEMGHDGGIIIKPYHLVANATLFRGMVPCCQRSRLHSGRTISDDLKARVDSVGLESRFVVASILGRFVAVAEGSSIRIVNLRGRECLGFCVR